MRTAARRTHENDAPDARIGRLRKHVQDDQTTEAVAHQINRFAGDFRNAAGQCVAICVQAVTNRRVGKSPYEKSVAAQPVTLRHQGDPMQPQSVNENNGGGVGIDALAALLIHGALVTGMAMGVTCLLRNGELSGTLLFDWNRTCAEGFVMPCEERSVLRRAA